MGPLYQVTGASARRPLEAYIHAMKIRGYILPLAMCILTVATVARYSQLAETRKSGQEYNFLVRTDEDGVMKIRSDLAEADLHRVEDSEIEDGLYRITVRCPPEKARSMWSVMAGRRHEK